jgi:tellurite resistance protein TerC
LDYFNPFIRWSVFFTIVLLLIILDLRVLNKNDHVISLRESIWSSVFYVSMGLGFSGWVYYSMGSTAALEYVTGFTIEKMLSFDNLFVISTIFSALSIPPQYQRRVLFWGILGVIILRALMIGLGAIVVSRWNWVLYIFSLFLVFTGYKLLTSVIKKRFLQMSIQIFLGLSIFGSLLLISHQHSLGVNSLLFFCFLITMLGILFLSTKEELVQSESVIHFLSRYIPMTKELHENHFFVTQNKQKIATPLFIALLTIEIIDLFFAADSIPAIFSVTKDPYIVYSSNIFAILGLRSLYFVLSALLSRFIFLQHALSFILLFIGMKLFLLPYLGLQHFPAALSMTIVITSIGIGIVASLIKTKKT